VGELAKKLNKRPDVAHHTIKGTKRYHSRVPKKGHQIWFYL